MSSALQVWALSDYPSLLGYFPSTSIYQNMNFLFWKRKEVAPLRPQFDTFPWICWYIWKARNDKLFNGKDVSPLATLQHAFLEAECWKKANAKEKTNEDHDDPLTTEVEIEPFWIPQIPTCQIDASWINNGSISGSEWSLKDEMGSEYFGLRACNRSLSALHAEMKCLFWAASCMRDRGITSIRFETDNLDLVDMTTDPVDWPAFATEIEMFQRLQENFEDVNLSHIPRSRKWPGRRATKRSKNERLCFFPYRSDPDRWKCSSENWLVCSLLDLV